MKENCNHKYVLESRSVIENRGRNHSDFKKTSEYFCEHCLDKQVKVETYFDGEGEKPYWAYCPDGRIDNYRY